MNALEALGLVGGIASIAGLVYALYYGRTSIRRKLLAYDLTPAVPFATVFQPDETHHLAVVYQHGDGPEERIDAAFIRFVRFANFGREPIRREDIAPANPVRIVVRGARTLDIALVGSRRDVCRVEVAQIEHSDDEVVARLTFDFLDEQDGGMARIVTANDFGDVAIEGDIIGMPGGVHHASELKPRSFWYRVGCTLGIVIQSAAIAVTPFIYKWVTGTWQNAWLLVLPLLALIVPGVIVAIVSATVWPSDDPQFPRELTLPNWFDSRLYLIRHAHMESFAADQLWSVPPRKRTKSESQRSEPT